MTDSSLLLNGSQAYLPLPEKQSSVLPEEITQFPQAQDMLIISRLLDASTIPASLKQIPPQYIFLTPDSMT